MSRTIKFRAWDSETNSMSSWTDISTAEGSVGRFFKRTDLIRMQFTGLTDKNGKEIYEGDILGREGNTDFVCEVKFSNGAFRGLTLPGGNHYRLLIEMMELERAPYVEIIGNIYENSDLLV